MLGAIPRPRAIRRKLRPLCLSAFSSPRSTFRRGLPTRRFFSFASILPNRHHLTRPALPHKPLALLVHGSASMFHLLFEGWVERVCSVGRGPCLGPCPPGGVHCSPFFRDSMKRSKSCRSYRTLLPILTWQISPDHPRLRTVQTEIPPKYSAASFTLRRRRALVEPSTAPETDLSFRDVPPSVTAGVTVRFGCRGLGSSRPLPLTVRLFALPLTLTLAHERLFTRLRRPS